MDSNQNKDESYVVTFSDFIGVIKRHRKNILIIIAACTVLGALFALNRPVKYVIEASFKERGIANNTPMGNLIGTQLGKKSSDKQSEARTWFTSYDLLKKLAISLDLNGGIYPKKQPFINFHRVMWNNFKVEYAYYRKRPSPFLKEHVRPVYLSDVQYDGELPTILDVTFSSDHEFIVTNIYGKKVGEGLYDVPFHGEDFSFVIHRDTRYPLEQSIYEISLTSPHRVAKGLKENITFKNDSLDEELIHLTTLHPDRYQGAQLINSLITLYKIHKVDEQRRVSDEQIAYLEERQSEAQKTLRKAMDEFAYEQSKDFETSGFISTDKALEFLATRQQEYQRRLLSIELENTQLEKVLHQGYVFYDRYNIDGDPTVINHLLHEIRQLKQQADSIKLSLQESPLSFDENERLVFDRQMGDLEDTQLLIIELRAIEKELANNHLLHPSDSLMNDPRIMLHSWYEKLKDYQQEYEWAQLSASDWENRKMQFATYIKNLIELFEVHEKALRERLANHGELKEEFKGIDLNLANEIFLNYNRALNETETELVKLQFILDSVQQPKFELNSLTSQLTDSISNDLVGHYSKLLLDLQDDSNRSQKEQERIRNELLRQRKFFEMHITQSINVHNLTAKLQRNKINSLQKMTLALIQLKISLLEKQLENFITSRINNLSNEKLVIEDQLNSVRREMATIPEKKVSEQMMQQRLDQSRDFGREITHLVETKNITNNLEVVLSKTVDEATAPIFPRSPKVLLFAVLGMMLGTIGSVFYYCLSEAIKGVTPTPENLSEIGLSVSGVLKNQSSDERSVLRRVIQSIVEDVSHEAIAMIGYGSMDVAKGVAKLLSKRGGNVLIISLSFDGEGFSGSGSSFLDYLEGRCEEPSITTFEDYDLVDSQKISQFGSELMASERFSRYVEKITPQYEWVICVSNSSVATVEGEQMLHFFNRICVVLQDERIESIKTAIHAAKHDDHKKVTFIWPN